MAPAWGQAIEAGDGVRVVGEASVRVNVRDEPFVGAGNVVATAQGGDLLRVQEVAPAGQHTWYRVVTLPGAAKPFRGWIRGDLLAPARLPEPTLPQVLATPAPPSTDTTPEPQVETPPVPLDRRTDWSRNLFVLYPAIQGCVRVGSAQPVTVLRAIGRARGLAEVILSDSAGRRWDCVIRATGGTPIRFDPLSGSVFMRDRMGNEPFFSTEAERPPLDPRCYRFERMSDPATNDHLGWLYYRTCA